MGVARDLPPHRAEAKALAGVIGRLPDAAIVQNDGLGPAAFQEKLAIVGPGGRFAQGGQRGGFVEMRVERAEGGVGHLGPRAVGQGSEMGRARDRVKAERPGR